MDTKITGKEILLSALNKRLNEAINIDPEVAKLTDENNRLVFILKKLNDDTNPDYKTNFILDLSDEDVELISTVLPLNEQKNFLVKVLPIKGIMNINLKNITKYKLSDEQIKVIYSLAVLLEKRINDINTKITLKSESVPKAKYRLIKEKIASGTAISPEDYDLITSLIGDDGISLEKVADYLNDYNLNIMQTPIKHEENIKPSINLHDAESSQRVKEILSLLGYDFDSFDEICKNELLSVKDYNKLEEFVKYLISSNFMSYFKTSNNHGICHMLSHSSIESVDKLLKIFIEKYKIDEYGIKSFVNRATMVFDDGEYNNVVSNFEFIISHGGSIKETINENITFFYGSSKTINKTMEALISRNINVDSILEKTKSILRSDTNTVLANIDVLDKYGFDLSAESGFSSYTVLMGKDLSTIFDSFIELGLGEYIHNNPTIALKRTKELIIKRIYYAFKNNLPIWSNHYRNSVQNKLNINISLNNEISEEEANKELPLTSRETTPAYDNIIEKSTSLKDSEIKELIINYPILERVEQRRYSPKLDDPSEKTKSLNELNYGTKIISRLKVYRVFNALVKSGVKENEALLYAITYNSILSEEEYQAIKDTVMGIEEKEVKL